MDEFRFKTRLDQTLLLGLKARTITELLEGIGSVPDSSIYHHTHRFLQQHHYLSPEPPNDFAYWIREVLNDVPLAEEISSIDTVRFDSIGGLRDAFAAVIGKHRGSAAASRECPPGGDFHFMASRIFVLNTEYAASSPGEFRAALRLVPIGSLYYHMFEARLRLGRGENDFSRWFRDHGMPELADGIARLDPYSYTLEGLRNEILRLGEIHDPH